MKRILPISLLTLMGGMTFTSCDKADNPATPDVEVPNVPGIPSDTKATPNPVVTPEELNAVLPNFQYQVSKENGWIVIRFDMTGVQDPFAVGEWVKLYGTSSLQQNVWLSIDDVPKGFSISNTIDNETERQVKNVDLVFLVDNSGSMDDEANALANQVFSWSQKLAQSDLDIRFGCVGYDGAITGGMNLGTIEELDGFLNNGSWGTGRTRHFLAKEGDDWNAWRNEYYVNSWSDECDVAALRLADENFSFRAGANRAYVNFTDEANYSDNKENLNVNYVKELENWPATKGTIHSVISEDSTNYWISGVSDQNPNYYQRPWRLSEYTGGTIKFVPRNFSGVTLDDLPITGALQNSYIIRITNVEELFDGQPHQVHITVKSPGKNGTVIADKIFSLIFEQ